MRTSMEHSIFSEYFKEKKLEDRFVINKEKEKGVDVIIPIINTNELWETNLYNFYKSIPINRLLIGNGGCTDESIDIVEKFPRVEVFDHSEYKSQGYSISNLMKAVETDYFIYLHADVYLPPGWFDQMYKHRNEFEWFECYRHFTVMIEYTNHVQNNHERSYSGSQFGSKEAFHKFVDKIDDDFLQRNEDIIFSELIIANGGKYGRVSDTFHYHQMLNKRGEKEPKLSEVTFKKESDPVWEKRIFNMQAKGIIKYLQPNKSYLVYNVNMSLGILDDLGDLDWKEFKAWVKEENSIWLKYIKKPSKLKKHLRTFLFDLKNRLVNPEPV